jgi:hypothetical protein
MEGGNAMHGSFENTALSRFVTTVELAKIAQVAVSHTKPLHNLLDLANADAALRGTANLSAAWGPSVGDDIPSQQIYL